MDNAFLFVIGLLVGSFVNVLALRYSGAHGFSKALRGRSQCPHCHKTLSWYELLPIISFLIQGRRCRHCRAKIYWQYPIVELMCGLIFLLPLYLRNPFIPVEYSWIMNALWIVIFLILVLVALIDFRLSIIPDELNIALGLLGIAMTVVQGQYGLFDTFSGSFLGGAAAIFGVRGSIWINRLLAVGLEILLLGIIIYTTKGRGMGMGDLKFLAALGLIFGWPDTLFITAFSFIIGAVFSIYLLVAHRKAMRDAVPFGPFLVLGTVVVFFFGNVIVSSYFSVFSLW